jgi:hypothetical protein
MSSKGILAMRNRVRLTALVTIGWLILMICWIAFAWNQLSFFQNLVGLGIAILIYAAITGALWVVDQGGVLVATILTTFGWLSFTLYWIGFGWSGHTFLLNSAILMLSLLVWLGVVTVLWLGQPSSQTC